MAASPEKNQKVLIIDTVFPLTLVPIPMEPITDQAASLPVLDKKGEKVLGKFKAVGAVADAVYQSGRVIPAAVQEAALRVAQGRQLTMFVDHPNKVVCDEFELHVGRLGLNAGKIDKFHYDPKTKQTVLDQFTIGGPEGPTAMSLFESGVQLGISQRALGTQERRTWEDAAGNKHEAVVVTALEIYGYDFVHLPDANAGSVTAIKPLTDSALSALNCLVEAEEINTLDLTDAELAEFAPLPAGVILVDAALPVHNPEKAEINASWKMTSEQQAALPDAAFAWVDPAYAAGTMTDKRRGRKLPHHLADMSTVFFGVRSAMAALNGARGGVKIPDNDRQGVYDHLAAHYKQFGVEPPVLKLTDSVGTTENNEPALDSVHTAENRGNTMTTPVITEPPKEVTPAVVAEVKTEPVVVADAAAQAAKTEEKPAVDAAELAITDANKQMVAALKAHMDETVTKVETLMDSLKNRMNAEAAKDHMWSKTRTAMSHAGAELDSVLASGAPPADINAKLAQLSSEMKATLNGVVEAVIQMCAQEESVGDRVTAKDSKSNDASATNVVADTKVEQPMPVADKKVENTEVAVAAAYVPPPDDAKVLADKAAKELADKQAAASKVLVDNANKALSAMKDSFSEINQKLAGVKNVTDMKAYAKAAVARQGLSENTSKAVVDTVLAGVTSNSTKESIEDSVKTVVNLVGQSITEERLKTMGLDDTGAGVSKMSTTVMTDKVNSALGAPHLKGVQALTDSFLATGMLQTKYATAKKEEIPYKLQAIMARFDKQFERELSLETAKLQSMVDSASKGENLMDAAAAADFTVPYVLSRIILFEAYASDLIQELTDTGLMEGPRDTVPITRWRREPNSVNTMKPSVSQRASLKVPELGAIPRGKLVTDFYNIDAVKRSLGATMSDEFMSRAKRRPDITGMAMAINNLIDDVRRGIQQDIFFEMIRAALMNGSSTFSTAINTNGSSSVWQVTGTGAPLTTLDAAVAVSIVPDDPAHSPLVVKLGTTSGNMTVVPLFGTQTAGGGTGSLYFYTVDYAAATISLVDSAGVAQVPNSGTANMLVTGRKADGEVRFNLNNDSGETTEKHMQRLLFAVQNQRAKNSSGGISSIGFYDANIVVASVVTSELMKQADAYSAFYSRKGFSADAMIKEGNYGITAGLAHWGSKVFSDQFVVVGDNKGVLFKTFEPLNLRGPHPGHDANGQLNGSLEWYTYQEDCIATPIFEKFCAITLYRK